MPASERGEFSVEVLAGVDVPMSLFRTEMRGSMNFVLYSERT